MAAELHGEPVDRVEDEVDDEVLDKWADYDPRK
ncbi:hypothetical protein BJ993_001222 [Nocardioides aromaticivorans]|uniref:Uncharacterized protein n=1 Tax=Nocardioides aromaticivorans TaxID=200618 RepID=A0A7Y9ZEW5_9ACTN|nr:hypothetical protein [Nocardioides aromaticivorans]